MYRFQFGILVTFFGTLISTRAAQVHDTLLEHKQWFEVRTEHFNIYSCGIQQKVYKLAGRLEQFCKAYSQLAGSQAVDSPPIVVIAFPDYESMKLFLPLYEGKPSNVAAFFSHGTYENLIVLSLPESDSSDKRDMEIIFHEYTHLLFRRNDGIWPVWLKEGMAEIYSTFQTQGRAARIAYPIAEHLHTLQANQLMPLSELFAVTHDSPQYNEVDRQGIFYAQSWLLTHFMMVGDNGQYRAAFAQFTALLHQGQPPIEAFTNSFQTTLSAMETGLHRYLKNGVFFPIDLSLSSDISAPVNLTTRFIPPVEVYSRLGDELMRIDRPDAAEIRFTQAQTIDPTSPLPEDGLGLLAVQREQHELALQHLKTAVRLGSTSFLVYYFCAYENHRATADTKDRYAQIKDNRAEEIRSELEQSIALMPDFGPAQELSGFFEMVQGEHPVIARQHLQRAIQLEPENLSYQFTLAQFYYRNRDPLAAHQTLAPLLQLNVDAKLRSDAQELLKAINQHHR
jgi:tetratricopeptide (TPR) repeat protein